MLLTLGGKKMFEIFFFVNPIGICCYESEQEIIDAIGDSHQKVDYHFIPLANMVSVRNDLKARQLPTCDIELFNKFSRAAFSAIKDYHAVKLLKGNKVAREFLLTLQSKINDEQLPYSAELVKELILNLGIDYQYFLNTKKTKYTLFSMNKDLQLAKKFKVVSTPTTFIYNYDRPNANYMIEGKINQDELQVILNEAEYDQNSNLNNLHLL